MPDPCAEIVCDPPLEAREWDLESALVRHRRCLALAELALQRAETDDGRKTLVQVCDFHRRRIETLRRRFAKSVNPSAKG